MIENPFAYVAMLMLICASIIYWEKESQSKIFAYVPAIVLIYFVVMLSSSLGLWQKSEAITSIYKSLKSHLLPAMIFLMLLLADMREIAKLGVKMILSFFLASLSIGLGFIIMFALAHQYFEAEAWKTFSALSGSWLGGTANMIAIQGALDLPDEAMGYTLLIDSIDYAIWVMLLLALVPFAKAFNLWSKADTSIIDKVAQKLSLKEKAKKPLDFASLFLLLALALAVSALSQHLSSFLPTNAFLTSNTWVIILATLMGILFAMSNIAKLSGANEIGNIMLYLIVALIASRADFAQLSQAPLYILSGFGILLIHLLLMLIFAKIFKLDLFSLGVASLANIGGIASAPILASAYHKALIPIAVLMAMLGYIIGTFGGLLIASILQSIAS